MRLAGKDTLRLDRHCDDVRPTLDGDLTGDDDELMWLTPGLQVGGVDTLILACHRRRGGDRRPPLCL